MGEKIHFDENADLEANYTIINWHRSVEDGSVVFEEVGYYYMHAKRGAKLLIDKSKIMWNGYISEVSQIIFCWAYSYFTYLFQFSYSSINRQSHNVKMNYLIDFGHLETADLTNHVQINLSSF